MLRRLLIGLGLVMLVPLPAALAFDGVRVIVLGSGGGAQVSGERAGSAVLVEIGRDVLLFDCGRGVAQRVWQAGLALSDITRVFLTHLHADTTLGCADLWWTGWMRGRDEPLRVTGPRGTGSMMQHLRQAYDADILSRGAANAAAAEMEVSEIAENIVYESDAARVSAFVVDHGAIGQAYGYRIESGPHVVVITGAARYSANLAENAKRASVLIHDVMAVDKDLLEASPALQREYATHSSPDDVARTLRTARPVLAVLSPLELVQVSEDDVLRSLRKQYPGMVEIGRDFLVVEMQNEIQLRGAPSGRAFRK